MSDACANCDCRLDEDCCGSREPFELEGIAYCCRGCAEDGVCTCGCVATGTTPSAAPVLSGF